MTNTGPTDTQDRRYVGPDSAQAGEIIQSHGFTIRRGVGYIMASTSICHPESGGRNLNLSIRDRPDGLSVKCFSHGCDARRIRDALESLGVGIRDYDPPLQHRHKNNIPPPTPVSPEHDRYIDLAFPGARIIHDESSFRRLVPGGHCFCADQTGQLSISPLYTAGFRFRCSQGCSTSRIIESITSQGLIVLRRFRYRTKDGLISRIRWDHATFDKPAKEYRGAGSLGQTIFLKIWHHRPNVNNLVIVEGEKAAEAVAAATDRVGVATWPNGVESVKYVDYTPAHAYPHVILWPDDDTTGRDAMNYIAEELPHNSLRIVATSGETGRDAADETPFNIVRIIQRHLPL